VDSAVAEWELSLAPWRRWSTAIGLAQAPLPFVGVIFLIRSETDRALVAAIAYALLEALKWAIESEALRRNPDAHFDAFYRMAPLPPSQRKFLTVTVFAAPLELVTLGAALAGTFDLSLAATAVFLGVFGLSWIAPLERVRRRGSWLAMTRLPSRPTRVRSTSVERPPAPSPQPQRSRARVILRWFLIVLLPLVIVAALFLVLAFLTRSDGNAQERRLVSSYVVEPVQVEWPEAARRFLTHAIAEQGGTLRHLSCGAPTGETSCRVTWLDARGNRCEVPWPLKVTAEGVRTTARDFIVVCTSSVGYRALPGG
jgi:hypothetical protein